MFGSPTPPLLTELYNVGMLIEVGLYCCFSQICLLVSESYCFFSKSSTTGDVFYLAAEIVSFSYSGRYDITYRLRDITYRLRDTKEARP